MLPNERKNVMKFELPIMPGENIKEAWPGQFSIFSWYAFVVNVPMPMFIVTTLKENGLANAQLSAWGMMIGSGKEPKFIFEVLNNSDTLRLIKTNEEFVVSYPSLNLKEEFMKTILHFGDNEDEILCSGLTHEPSLTVKVPRVKECFAHFECKLDWIRDVESETKVNTLIQGSILHAAIDDSVLSDDIHSSFEKRSFAFDVQEMINPQTGTSLGTGITLPLDISRAINL